MAAKAIGGYMKKVLRVDLDREQISEEVAMIMAKTLRIKFNLRWRISLRTS